MVEKRIALSLQGLRSLAICLSLSVCFFICLASFVSGQDYRSRLKGLVFEAEDWSTPEDAWLKDQHPTDKWCLWTKEIDVDKKRSGGQSLQSPTIRADRDTPEEGAPPLHTHISGIPSGLHRVWMNNPARTIALSFDGVHWQPYHDRGELNLGIHRIDDGTFDLWVDDRYAFPDRIGSCYYDYLRFERFEPPKFEHLTTFTLPDGRTQISWTTDKPFDTGSVYFGPGDSLDSRTDSDGVELRNHAVILPPLKSDELHSAQVRVSFNGEVVAQSKTITFMAGSYPVSGTTQPQRVRLRVEEPTTASRIAWPVTSGIPFAKGTLASVEDVRMLGPDGKLIPAQFESMANWPDGSIRWLLVDFQATTHVETPVDYVLETGSKEGTLGEVASLIRKAKDGFILDPGPLQIRVDRQTFTFPGCVSIGRDGQTAITTGSAEIITADGTIYRVGVPEHIHIETNGPLRGVLRVEGHYVDDRGQPLMAYRSRLTVYRDRPDIRIQWTIGNNRTSDTFAELNRASLYIPLVGAGPLSAALADGQSTAIADTSSLTVLQDYDDRVTIKRADATIEGTRESGFVRVEAGGFTTDTMIRDFWQTYPKGLEVSPQGIRLDLLPALPENQFTSAGDLTDERQIALFYCYRDGKYLFKRGMEYTADVMLSFQKGKSEATAKKAAHWQEPLMAVAPPTHYCASGAFWWIDPWRSDEFPRHCEAFRDSFEKLEQGRQDRHEYGWMNYGDWWGERSWNWGNSEYDLQYVCANHFAQTGNLDAFWRGDQMARHNTTIDVIHYPWQPMRELVYTHCVGHVGGFFGREDNRITNRVYSMTGFISGVQDRSGGHTYQGGNFLYGFLTGDRRYLEVANTVCWNQATTYTPNWNFGIERACGWSLYNAISAYESTLNPYYLNAARIYLEKVYELQDPETGGWRMRQGPPECDCPDAPHIGGKAFATGVLLHGLMMVDRVSPDAKVKESLVRGVDWLLDHSWNEEKQGFRYKTGCPKYVNHGWYTPLVTDSIAYAYELTKDDRYRDFLLRTIPVPASKVTGSGRSSGKNFASHFRHLPHALHFVRKWGTTSLPIEEEHTQ